MFMVLVSSGRAFGEFAHYLTLREGGSKDRAEGGGQRSEGGRRKADPASLKGSYAAARDRGQRNELDRINRIFCPFPEEMGKHSSPAAKRVR